MLEVSVLASGSSGNCFYVGSSKGDFLIDAGISCRQVVDRLKGLGKDVQDIKGIFLTHEHTDHVRGVEALTRKYNIPIYVNKGTLENCYLDMGNINIIKTDQEFDFLGMKIMPFKKSHDSKEPVSFFIKSGTKKMSVLTDIGCCCENVITYVEESDCVVLESNHDLNMLKNGPYPYFLKKRIASTKGHLSNYEAALLILEYGKKNLSNVFLSHLSLNNNRPELALNTFQAITSERDDLKKLNTMLTFRERSTEIIDV